VKDHNCWTRLRLRKIWYRR